MAFSRDSPRLALASRLGQLDVILLGEKITSISLNMKLDFARPNALEFLPGGERLVIGSSNARVNVITLGANVANMGEQDTVVYRGHRSNVQLLAADPTGKFLYSGAEDGQVLRWDLAVRDQRTHDIKEQTGRFFMDFYCLAYSPDGRWLAAGGNSHHKLVEGRVYKDGEEAEGRLLLIDTATRQVRQKIDWPVPVKACSFSADGKFLVYGGSGEKQPPAFGVWNVTEAKPWEGWKGLKVEAACFAGADRVALAAADGNLQTRELASGKSQHWPTQPTPHILELLANADGTLIASRSTDGVIHLWDAKTGRERRELPGHHPSLVMALSADASLAAWTKPNTTSDNGSARERQAVVFDLVMNGERFTIGGHSTPISALALSSDGRRLASGDEEGILKLWDVTTGQELMGIEDAHPGTVRAIVFHPGGHQMATVGDGDGRVRIWWTE
jgi:WD40 repeat protein